MYVNKSLTPAAISACLYTFTRPLCCPTVCTPLYAIKVFSYQPNQEGQKSTEDVEGVPVYRFAEVEKAMMAFLPEFEYKLYKGNEETEVVFVVKQQFLFAIGMHLHIYRQDDATKTPVATISQRNATAFGGDEYECSVTKNMDLLGVLCIACAADDMVNDK